MKIDFDEDPKSKFDEASNKWYFLELLDERNPNPVFKM